MHPFLTTPRLPSQWQPPPTPSSGPSNHLHPQTALPHVRGRPFGTWLPVEASTVQASKGPTHALNGSECRHGLHSPHLRRRHPCPRLSPSQATHCPSQGASPVPSLPDSRSLLLPAPLAIHPPSPHFLVLLSLAGVVSSFLSPSTGVSFSSPFSKRS